MRFRKLRIAWSLVFGFAAVLLIALWARSYWWQDSISGDLGSHNIYVGCNKGKLGFSWVVPISQWRQPLSVSTRHLPGFGESHMPPAHGVLGFRWRVLGNGWEAEVPCSFSVLLSAAFVAFPWIFRRFSLRTLLIVTTLVAVVLGIIVALRH